MRKEILRLAIPNIISNISVPLTGLVDIAMMGHLNSSAYIGAIALGAMIFSILYSIFGFLRMGTTGFTAQAYGANQPKQISLTLGRGLVIAAVSAAFLLLCQLPIEWISFKLLEGSPEVELYAAQYFRIRIWAAPATIALYALIGWFIGMQNTVIPLVITLVINILNVGLNLLFVLGLGMTSDGVALGTLCAQYGGLFVAILFYLTKYRKRYPLRFTKAELFKREELVRFFKVNRDIFIRTLLLILSISFFTVQSTKSGNDLLAVNTLLLQFFFFFSYFIDGFANAAEALTGRFIGAREPKKLKKMVIQVFIWGFGLSLPFTLIYASYSESILRLLTNNQDVIDLAKPYIFWIAVIPIASFAAFVWDGIYVGATASVPMRNSMIISSLLLYIPLFYLLRPYGNHGLWLAFLLFMVGRWVFLTLFAKRYIFSEKVIAKDF